jgi:hypothetical protein
MGDHQRLGDLSLQTLHCSGRQVGLAVDGVAHRGDDAFVNPAEYRLAAIVPPVDDPQEAITLIGKPAALQRIPAHLVAAGTQLLELGQLPLAQ